MLEREEEATACAQGWKGVDRNVRLGGATHSESAASAESVLCALPSCPTACDAPDCKARVLQLPHLHRAHPDSLARVPIGMACQRLSRIRHRHACHRRTSSERVQDGGSQRPKAAGRGLDAESAAARRSRDSPPRGYTRALAHLLGPAE